MKSIIFSFVLLAMLSKVARPAYDDSGYLTLTTVTNDDPTSCLVTLSVEFFQRSIKFTATIVKNDFYDCTHHDLQYFSWFKGDNLNGAVVLSPTANPNVKSGSMTLADVIKYNGTACLYNGYQVDNGVPYYSCQFRYNNLVLSIDLGVAAVTGDFPTDGWFNVFNPSLGLTKMVNQSGYNVWKANITYPQIVGMLYNQCGSWSSIISSLNNEWYITGTEYQSNTLNLHTLLGTLGWNTIWVRKRNSPSTYISYAVYLDFSTIPFGNEPVNNCSDMGMKYQAFLPDLNYCKDGCDLTMILLADGAIYALQTAGFTTQP